MKTSQDQMLFFILGRQGELCAQEVESCLERNNVPYKIILKDPSQKYVLVNMPTDFKPNISHLGGTIKWGIIKEHSASDLSPEYLAEFIKRKSHSLDSITYGITIWPSEQKELDLSLKVKRLIKERHARFIPPHRLLTAKTLIKNKLIDYGLDINIFRDSDYFYKNSRCPYFIGSTKEVQDVDEYTRRDVGRPERSMQRGLMPPKLAQIMINLAELDDLNLPILDPFCGSGTILQEAYFMGYKNLIGSDSDNKALEQTQKNLKSLGVPESAFELINADACHINKKVGEVGAVVTEPYLGPTALIKSVKQIEKINKSLGDLYQETLRGISQILPPGRRIVMVIPTRDGLTSSLDPEKYGLRQLHSLKYHRSGQIIVRNIKVLQKT